MSAADKTQWAKKNRANIISKAEYEKLRELADSNSIALSNVRKFDGSPSIIEESIKTLAALKSKFPAVADEKHKLTLALAEGMDAADFAMTHGRIITLNANAYRDVKLLQAEYQKTVDAGWFVKGTTPQAIIHHEFGHVVADIFKINPLKIACEITGLNDKATLAWLYSNLSKYAGSAKDGGEIISEVFADMSSRQPCEFSRKFYAKVLEAIGNA